MVDKFSSIDMKSTTTKSVLELKGELRLICCSQDTWDMWTTFFDAHSAGDIVNPETETKYASEKDGEAPPITREFFRPLQGLTESELHRCAVHLLGNTVGRKLPYPKIFLRRPKHKPGTYYIKEWCDHRKLKTNAMRELSLLLPDLHMFDIHGEINWEGWREFKLQYHVNGSSMRSLVKEHIAMLKLKGNKRSKKTETEAAELQRYITFLERKRNATFHGIARFCLVTTGLTTTTFSGWDDGTSRMEVREDRRGCPFGIIDFRCIPGCGRQGIKGMPFYEPFMSKFVAFKSPSIREPHVWLWISDHERLAAVTDFYEAHIKHEYILFHSTYLPCKTEGITAINEARGNKQVGAVCLMFLCYNKLRDGRAPVKSSHFKKLYSVPHPPPKELFQETLYSVFPGNELRMEFYVEILQGLAMDGETVYNVFGGSKVMYAAMVSHPCPIFEYSPSLNPMNIYERPFVNVHWIYYHPPWIAWTFTNGRS
jgi:hypothetical protein